MSGLRVAIITGASSGIGFDAAIKIVKQGIHTIIASRGGPRLDEAVSKIKKAAGREHVDSIPLDLCDLQSVRDFASSFKAKKLPLHILVLNAGLQSTKKVTTKDGNESTFQANHLGHFLLTELLLDNLRASAPSRIVVTSSGMHDPESFKKFSDSVEVNLDNFNFENDKKYSAVMAYRFSKLANLWFIYELNRRLEGSGVIVNAFNPGWIPTTDFARDYNWFLRKCMLPIMTLFAPTRTVDHGGNCIVDLATDEKIQTTGKYYNDRKETQSAPNSYEVESQKRLWEISEKLSGLAH